MNKTMHASFLVLYFIALVLAGTSPLFAAGAALAFFLVTSFRVLKMIVVLAVMIGGLCVLFPFLAPVAFILAVVFFVLRIRFIIRNIYAILAGAYVYGVLAAFGLSHIGLLGYTAYALAAVAVLVLHVILKQLYRMGYTTTQAFGIMGLVPLLVIAFVLPFLKIPVVHESIAVHPGAGISYDAFHGAHINHSSYINPYADEPTVTVRPYIKEDGTFVEGHVRTAPDEVESNNLSYRG